MVVSLGTRLKVAAISAVLLVGSLGLSGCASDPVAPQDEIPPLDAEDTAYQAGALAAGVVRAMPQMLAITDQAAKNVYTYDFADIAAVDGHLLLDFRSGGESGSPATSTAGNWCRMYTEAGQPVLFSVTGDLGGQVGLTLDVRADIDQGAGTAALLDGSSGTYTSGAYHGSYDFSGIVVQEGRFSPTSGTMGVYAYGFDLMVTFDGDHTATVTFGEQDTWIVDLDTGQLTEVVE